MPYYYFIGAKDNGGGVDNWSYKSCKAPVKCHHQQTNIQLFAGRMPFLLLCVTTTWKNDLTTLPTTTNGHFQVDLG